MINILLVCSAGMSTSMLVKKMQETADEKGVEANIWSVGDADSQDAVKKADIILLGPQVRFIKKKMEDRVNHEKPVEVIDMRVYGTMDGKTALETALKQFDEFRDKK